MNRSNSSGSSKSNRRGHHTMMGGGGSAYDDSYPSRPAFHTRPQQTQQQQTRRSRPHPDNPDTMSSDMDHQSSPDRPQHEQLSSSPPQLSPAFDFFYSLIFSLVHAALTVVLAPVLGKASKTSRRRQRRDTERPITDDDDPELAMSYTRDNVHDNSDGVSVASGGSGSGPYQPILRRESRRLSDLSSAENRKNVRFPEPAQRARPPLGRIGSSVLSSSVGSSSHSAGSHSTGSSSSSSRERSSRSSRTASGHRTSSRPSTASSNNTRPSNFSGSGRPQRVRASSPFGRMASPRMAHSTYFLE